MPTVLTLASIIIVSTFTPIFAPISTEVQFGINGKAIICPLSWEIADQSSVYPSSNLHIDPDGEDAFTFSYGYNFVRRFLPSYIYAESFSQNDPVNSVFGVASLKKKWKNHGANWAEREAWDRVGFWRGADVVALKSPGLFLVRGGPGTGPGYLFDADPRLRSSERAALARCIVNDVTDGIHASTTECTRTLEIGRIRVDYHFEIRNSSIIANLDRFIWARVGSWRKNCGGMM